MRKGSRVILPVTVSIRVGRPIATEGRTAADREALVSEVRASVEEMLRLGPVQ
jgi:hypothetical protein